MTTTNDPLQEEVFYVIHMPHRVDRIHFFQENYSFLSYRLFTAIVMEPGRRGCALSHIQIIKMAQASNMPYVMIMEDDACITDKTSFVERLSIILVYLKSHMSEWDLFNGGINKTGRIDLIDKDLPIVRYGYAYCTHFVIYNASIYDKMIGLESYYRENEKVEPIDVVLNRLTDRKWTTVPFLCYQHNNYSDVDKLFAPNFHRLKREEIELTMRTKQLIDALNV